MMISRKAVSTVVVVGAMVMIQQTAIVTAFVSRLVFLVHMTKPFGGLVSVWTSVGRACGCYDFDFGKTS